MPAASGRSLTRADIEAWSVEHLDTAETHWTSTAKAWEEHFTTIHNGVLRPGGTVWEGAAAEAAAEHSWGDLVKVRGLADALLAAAGHASSGAGDIAWLKRQVLNAIAEAEEAGFTVGQDLSVTDPNVTALMRGWDQRQQQAIEHAQAIQAAVQAQVAADKQAAERIHGALASLDQKRFGDGQGAAAKAMGFKFKTDMQDGDHDPYTGADNHKPQPKLPLPPQFNPNTGVAQGGGGPLGPLAEGEIAVPAEVAEAEAALSAHARALGMDAATGGFRMAESQTGLRVEQELGVNLTRAGSRDAYDWIDASGKTYDAVGNFPAKYFDAQWSTLQGRIMDHLAKADIVPVDVSQFTAAQREIVREFIQNLKNSRVVMIGGE